MAKVIQKMTDLKLSVRQFQEMRHALGDRIKKSSHRNHYNTGDECDSWNELVEAGLATKHDMNKEMGGITYSVTDKGIDILYQMINC